MKRLSKKSIGLVTLAALVLLLVVSLFVKFETTLKGPGRFVASSEWTVVQVEQDKVQSVLISNGVKQQHDIQLFHFNRPDYVQVQLQPGLNVGSWVEKGTLIASISSHEDQLRLASLYGELQQAQANLNALSTGAKTALQEEMQRAVEYAQTQLEAYEPILQRHKDLFEQQLISEQEYDTVRAQYDLYKIEKELQEARLQAAKTGEKQEALDIFQAQIQSISDQLDILQEKSQAETIRSPISGIVVRPDRNLGEIIHICNTDTMVIQMPVKASDIPSVQLGMTLTAKAQGASENFRMLVSGISHNSTLINLQPMFMVMAEFENPNRRLIHGMTGNMEIATGQSTWWNMLTDAWQDFRFNR